MKKNFISFFTFLLLYCPLVNLFSVQPDLSNPEISVEMLDTILNDVDMMYQIQVIDIRSKNDFKESHIIGALNLTSEQKISEHIQSKPANTTFIIYSFGVESAETMVNSLRKSTNNRVGYLNSSYSDWLAYKLNTHEVVSPEALLKKIDEKNYMLNNIHIDLEKAEISFPVEFINNQGPIEVLLTGWEGKAHETVLVTEAIPSQLQVALLLIGADCGLEMNNGVAPDSLMGDGVEIFVQWTSKEGKIKTLKASELTFDVKNQQPMNLDRWIFRGSMFKNNKFWADVELAIISTYNFPGALIDNPLAEGIDDTSYVVNTAVIPPLGTKAKLIVKK